MLFETNNLNSETIAHDVSHSRRHCLTWFNRGNSLNLPTLSMFFEILQSHLSAGHDSALLGVIRMSRFNGLARHLVTPTFFVGGYDAVVSRECFIFFNNDSCYTYQGQVQAPHCSCLIPPLIRHFLFPYDNYDGGGQKIVGIIDSIPIEVGNAHIPSFSIITYNIHNYLIPTVKLKNPQLHFQKRFS